MELAEGVYQPDPNDLVDPDLRAATGALPDLGGLSEANLSQVRALLAGEPPRLGITDGIEVSWVTIAGLAGEPDCTGLLYRPVGRQGQLPAVLNVHGGGYVAGSAQREDARMRALVGQLGCIALSPEYRLAPEAPYPAALRDCHAALLTLGAMLQVDPARIALRGVSAGGGLALALGLLAREGQAPAIAHLHLIYPMLDDRTGPVSGKSHFVWTAAANRFAWDAHLANVDRSDPPGFAAPARARDLTGLPPVFLAVGAIDLFAQETLTIAGRMIAAGVSVDLHVYAGAFHGFDQVLGSRVAQAFERDSRAAIQRYLNMEEVSK